MLGQQSRDTDDDGSDSLADAVREDTFEKTWDQLYHSSEHLLFGLRTTAVDLSSLHPEQVQIFKLWQVYLDNVDPLLKVTHTPTLQRRIIDAASNVANVKPTLAALMFSIYCVSILSLTNAECHAMFGSPRDHLLTGYQLGCQQALWKCGFLRSGDCECLTALYLYLVSPPASSFSCLPDIISCRSDLIQTLGLCPLCSVLQSVSRNAWASTASRLMSDVTLLTPKCVEGSGGRLYCLTGASAIWPLTDP